MIRIIFAEEYSPKYSEHINNHNEEQEDILDL